MVLRLYVLAVAISIVISTNFSPKLVLLVWTRQIPGIPEQDLTGTTITYKIDVAFLDKTNNG